MVFRVSRHNGDELRYLEIRTVRGHLRLPSDLYHWGSGVRSHVCLTSGCIRRHRIQVRPGQVVLQVFLVILTPRNRSSQRIGDGQTSSRGKLLIGLRDLCIKLRSLSSRQEWGIDHSSGDVVKLHGYLHRHYRVGNPPVRKILEGPTNSAVLVSCGATKGIRKDNLIDTCL